jgi:hypothetical protein
MSNFSAKIMSSWQFSRHIGNVKELSLTGVPLRSQQVLDFQSVSGRRWSGTVLDTHLGMESGHCRFVGWQGHARPVQGGADLRSRRRCSPTPPTLCHEEP